MINTFMNNLPIQGLSGTNLSSKAGTNQNATTDIASIFNTSETSQETSSNQKQDGLPQNQDPDSYAQEYADENGISLEEAKAELEKKYGKPQAPNQNFSAEG